MVCSFGVVLWELMTWQVPFSGRAPMEVCFSMSLRSGEAMLQLSTHFQRCMLLAPSALPSRLLPGCYLCVQVRWHVILPPAHLQVLKAFSSAVAGYHLAVMAPCCQACSAHRARASLSEAGHPNLFIGKAALPALLVQACMVFL